MIRAWQRGDRAVALGAELDVVDLVAAVVGRGHVLRARLDPLHRPPSLRERPQTSDLLAVDLQLRAEAAADVGRDHADLVLAHPEQDRRGTAARGAGSACEVQRVSVAGAVLGHARRAARSPRPAVRWLTIRRSTTTSASREAGLDVAAAERPLVGLVGAELAPRRAASRPRARPPDRSTAGSGSYSTIDLLGRVDHPVLVLADDHGHRIADVLDLAAGQRPVLGRLDLDAGRHPDHRQRRRESSRSSPVKTADDAGRVLAPPDVSIETIGRAPRASARSPRAACPGATMSST